AANRWQETVSGIAKVVKVDDYNVKFELSRPSPSLLYTLTQPGLYMVSPKAIADGSWLTVPVGTGPYVYDEAASVSGSKYVF
ncbi:ABC transporter substrate-binding protein, partial [Rhizobiaceae sp. 2RAB30]